MCVLNPHLSPQHHSFHREQYPGHAAAACDRRHRSMLTENQGRESKGLGLKMLGMSLLAVYMLDAQQRRTSVAKSNE